MKGKPYVFAGTFALVLATALGLSTSITQADSRKAPKLPTFVADGSWPKMPLPSAGDFGTPLVISTSTGKPKPWSTGEVAGTCIDSQDHVFIVTRGNLVNSPETLDSVPAPPVIEFDIATATSSNAWGDRNVLPNGIHGCFVDYQDNIWIAGNGDGIVQKYSHNGDCCCCRSARAACATTRRRNTCGNSGGEPARQPEQDAAEPAGQHVRRSESGSGDGPARQHLHRRRLRQPPRRRVQTRQGTYLRQWGGVGGDGEQPGDRLRPACSPRATAAIRTASRSATTAWSTCATAPTTASRCSPRRAHCSAIIPVVPGTGVTLGNRRRTRARHCRLGVGPRLLQRR